MAFHPEVRLLTCPAVALKNCLARIGSAAALAFDALVVWRPRGAMSLGAGMWLSDAVDAAAAAEVVAAGAAGVDGLHRIGGPYAELVYPTLCGLALLRCVALVVHL